MIASPVSDRKHSKIYYNTKIICKDLPKINLTLYTEADLICIISYNDTNDYYRL